MFHTTEHIIKYKLHQS